MVTSMNNRHQHIFPIVVATAVILFVLILMAQAGPNPAFLNPLL